MQALRILFLFTICFSFFNCSDDGDDFKFYAESLIQTKWAGDFKEYLNGENIRNSKVGFIFYNNNDAEYDVKADYETTPNNVSIKYSIDGKILTIPGGNTLGGKWMITQAGKNTMTLERGTGAEDGHKGIITLTKVN